MFQDCNNDRACKLLFYIEGKKLDRTLTLYQAILQQQIKSDDEFISGTKLWSQVHTITYRRAVESLRDDPQNCLHLGQKFTLLDGVKEHMEFASLF